MLKVKLKPQDITLVPPIFPVQARHVSGRGFGGSRYIDSVDADKLKPEQFTEVEKSYAEWEYVEQLLPLKYIPEPPSEPEKVHPSGWKYPLPVSPDAQYVIRRTKNHMIPVYLFIFEKERGERRWTRIKHVEGNIWALEKDVGNYLQEKYPNTIIKTWVNESWRSVYIHGEYDVDVREWAMQQGF